MAGRPNPGTEEVQALRVMEIYFMRNVEDYGREALR
jgi:hypothetical protein